MSKHWQICIKMYLTVIAVLVILLFVNTSFHYPLLNYIIFFISLLLLGSSSYIYLFFILPILEYNKDLKIVSEKDMPSLIEKNKREIEKARSNYQEQKELHEKYCQKMDTLLQHLASAGIYIFEIDSSGNVLMQLPQTWTVLFDTNTENLFQRVFFSEDKKSNVETWLQSDERSVIEETFFCKQQHGKVSFRTFIHPSTENNLVILQNINDKVLLQEKYDKSSKLHEKNMQSLWEIIRSNTEILRDFLIEIPQKIATIQNEFSLLQEQSANRSILSNLTAYTQEIKNYAHLLKWHGIMAKCSNIETLSGIVATKSGEIRFEQLLEMERSFQELVETLERYQKFGQQHMLELERNKKNNKLSFTKERLQNVESHFQVLQRMIFAGDIYRGELNDFLNATYKALANVVDVSDLENKFIFEFTDQFQQIFSFYYPKVSKKNIMWDIVHKTERVLLYGDCVKINKLLTLYIYMSILLAENNSSLTIESQIIPAINDVDLDVLEIRTHVGVTNKATKTKAAIKKLFREYQKLSTSSLAELEEDRKGFRFRLPAVINKKLGKSIQIAIFGNISEKFHEKLMNCAKFFPFEFETILNPANCKNADIAIADYKVVETLGEHIQNQLQKANHLIPILITMEKKEQDLVAFFDKYFYLNLPVRTMQLRWLIFQCLDYIIAQQKAPQIGKTVMFRKPNS